MLTGISCLDSSVGQFFSSVSIKIKRLQIKATVHKKTVLIGVYNKIINAVQYFEIPFRNFVLRFFVFSEMKGNAVDTPTSAHVSTVTATLQLIVLLEEWRPSALQRVSVVSRIARLMCVFLTGRHRQADQSWNPNLRGEELGI